jgi:hypothetical protein
MKKSLATALLAVSMLANTPAYAAEQTIHVELNKTETKGDACRVYMIVGNESGRALETLKLDLVLFDTDGVVAKRLAVETAPLPIGKTGLKIFDIADMACPTLGRMLLNDVLACADANGPVANCLSYITPTAKGDLTFIK